VRPAFAQNPAQRIAQLAPPGFAPLYGPSSGILSGAPVALEGTVEADRLPRKLAAIVYADAVGFSLLNCTES
jgi:hypothetical protein